MMNDKELEIINYLVENNSIEYNKLKASEECQELALVLVQSVLKEERVPEQDIIDEIGDVIIRLEILKKIYSKKSIKKRVDYKLSKFKQYIETNKYTQI